MCKHNALDIIVTLPFYASTLTYNMSRIKICRWGDGYGSSSLKSILHLLQDSDETFNPCETRHGNVEEYSN